MIKRDDTSPYKYTWFWNMDYEPVRYHQLDHIIGKFKRLETEIRNISNTIRINQSSILSLEPLIEQGAALKKAPANFKPAGFRDDFLLHNTDSQFDH